LGSNKHRDVREWWVDEGLEESTIAIDSWSGLLRESKVSA